MTEIHNFLMVYGYYISIILGIIVFIVALTIKSKGLGIFVAFISALLITYGTVKLVVGDSEYTPTEIKEILTNNELLKEDILKQERINDSLLQVAQNSEQRALDFALLLNKYKSEINYNKSNLNEKIIRIDSLSDSELNNFFTDYGKRYYQEYINFKN